MGTACQDSVARRVRKWRSIAVRCSRRPPVARRIAAVAANHNQSPGAPIGMPWADHPPRSATVPALGPVGAVRREWLPDQRHHVGISGHGLPPPILPGGVTLQRGPGRSQLASGRQRSAPRDASGRHRRRPRSIPGAWTASQGPEGLAACLDHGFAWNFRLQPRLRPGAPYTTAHRRAGPARS